MPCQCQLWTLIHTVLKKKNMQETALGFTLRTLEHPVSTCYEATRAKVGISTLKESLRGVLDEP